MSKTYAPVQYLGAGEVGLPSFPYHYTIEWLEPWQRLDCFHM